MYILLGICQNPTILRIIYFGSLLLNIVTTIVPIGLILMLLIDFTKNILTGDEKVQTKNNGFVIKRIIGAIAIFTIPWIVNIIMTILSLVGMEIGNNYTACLNNARSGDFTYYDNLLKMEKAVLEKEKQQNIEKENEVKINNAFAKKLISIAEGELGNTDDDSGKYGPEGLPWCAYFVTWTMKSTEIDGVNLFYDIIEKHQKVESKGVAGCTIYNFNTSDNLKFYYSDYYIDKYNKNYTYTPKPGDTIYFTRNNSIWDGKIVSCREMYKKCGHIGLVHHVEGDTVYTIEGNLYDQVKINSLKLNESRIMGYGSWYNN